MSFHRKSSFHPAEQWHAQPLSALPTPSVVIDRAIFVRNSRRMLDAASQQGMKFRVHIKTHKTSEGTRIQLDPFEYGDEGRPRTNRLIVSTVEEGWMLVNSGTLRDFSVRSVLYSLPPAPNTLQRLAILRTAMAAQDCTLLLMVDLPAQITAIEGLSQGEDEPWQAFIKVDAGYHRAGVPVHTQQFEETVKAVLGSSHTSLYGFYVHAGNSYSVTSREEANTHLDNEMTAVTEASILARGIIEANEALKSKYAESSFVLSVGATPTANAARIKSEESDAGHVASSGVGNELELHAGNYSLYDLQQFATSMIDEDQIGLFVLSTVCSVYPGRNSSIGEALCDAGGLAMSKDKGPLPGHGNVRSDTKQGLAGWYLGRIAQEHGVLTSSTEGRESSGASRLPRYGEKLRILPQHACMTLANHPWIFIVDSSLETEGTDWEEWTVRDVWTPAKFW